MASVTLSQTTQNLINLALSHLARGLKCALVDEFWM